MKKRPYTVFDLGEPLCISIMDLESNRAGTIPVERVILLFSDRKKALQTLHKMFGESDSWVEQHFEIRRASYAYSLQTALDHLIGLTDCSKFFDGEKVLTRDDVTNNF